MLNLIIFGAPGSGKGTQSEYLEKNYNLYHISTGDVLREEIRKHTPLGETAKRYIDQGHLVPDDLIIEMLKGVISRANGYEGFIFDGFPRTVIQAEALTKMLNESGQEVDLLIDLNVPEDMLIDRLLQRGKVSGRSDDNEVAIKQRLQVYHEQTYPVIDYYKRVRKHLPVDGTGSIEEIARSIVEKVDAHLGR